MSDEEKKNGEYEKPESHEMEGDELDGVSAGAGVIFCDTGYGPASYCGGGSGGDDVTARGCLDGHTA
jgi:hypothetical protein